MQSNNLQGQTAIVTGASSGIGRAVAKELDRHGVSLVLTARREEILRDLAGRLTHPSAVVPGDITDENLPQQLIDAALEQSGRLDVLVNNAGIMEVGSIQDIDIDRVCRMVRSNVESVYRLSYLALRHFLGQRRGHLINVSSLLGTKVRPTTGAYAGTKYAIEAFTEALRMETAGTGVRVASIQPGLTETHLQDHFPQHPAKTLNIEKMAQPEDLARGVLFLLQQPPHINVPSLLMMPSEQAM